jgi:hypothetical protein
MLYSNPAEEVYFTIDGVGILQLINMDMNGRLVKEISNTGELSIGIELNIAHGLYSEKLLGV